MQALRKSKLVRIVVVILCGLYLLNPTAGLIEFLPDNLPLVGNLDEFAATFLMFAALNMVPWINSPSRLRWVVLGMIGAISVVYLLNPTAGFLEFIPDNFPIVGNFDEMIAAFGASALLAQMYYPRLEKARLEQEMAMQPTQIADTTL